MATRKRAVRKRSTRAAVRAARVSSSSAVVASADGSSVQYYLVTDPMAVAKEGHASVVHEDQHGNLPTLVAMVGALPGHEPLSAKEAAAEASARGVTL